VPLDTVEREDRAIVITGSFQPGVLTPSWLRSKGILAPSELDSDDPVEQLFVTPEIVAIPGSWFSIRALPDRLMFVSPDAEMFGSLRDLAVDVLDQYPNPRISAIGLNTILHFRLPEGHSWERIRSVLAPSRVWEGTPLDSPFVRSLTLESDRTDELLGARFVRIEPSAVIEDGVFVELNDHVQLGAQRELVPAATPLSGVEGEAMNIMRSEWDSSYQMCRDIAERLTIMAQGEL
jgi:hypothetical protein